MCLGHGEGFELIHLQPEESGQTVVEFSIIAAALMILTVGLIDVGRAFYQYNAVAAAARYGARWASVVGGTCSPYNGNLSANNDWCNMLGTSSATPQNPFWTAAGNVPVQASGTAC